MLSWSQLTASVRVLLLVGIDQVSCHFYGFIQETAYFLPLNTLPRKKKLNYQEICQIQNIVVAKGEGGSLFWQESRLTNPWFGALHRDEIMLLKMGGVGVGLLAC